MPTHATGARLARDARTRRITSVLKNTYPKATIILTYANPWELLVAVILSAQCTDTVVNSVTEKLFKKYTRIEDYVRADAAEFEKDIRPTGFFRNKARNILATAKIIIGKHHGNVPDTMEELTALPGVARKTANIILGNAFGKVEGIAVDTHVLRLSQRLRLVLLDRIGGKKSLVFDRDGEEIVDFVKDADPVKIERELMAVIPRNDWFQLTYLLIDHGRAICKARKPNCTACILRALCPSSRTD